MKRETPDKGLQAKLRKMVLAEGSSLQKVSKDLRLTRSQLSNYLADLPMNAAVLRGIEKTLTEAGDGGLRR
jgi:hypothetical protein